MRNFAVDVFQRLPGLEPICEGRIDGVIDRPDAGLFVCQAVTEGIPVLCMPAAFGQPETAVRGFLNPIGPGIVWCSILSDDLCQLCDRSVRPVHVGGAVGDGSSAVLHGITGPDGRVGIIEPVAVRIEIPVFPREVPLDGRPCGTQPGRVARPSEMIQHLVDEHQVHIIVMGAFIATGVARYITTAERACAQLLQVSCEVEGGVHHHGCCQRSGYLRLKIAVEMCTGTVVPSQYICHIGSAPTVQPHPPGDGAVHVGWIFPDGVRRDGQGGTQCVDVWIRRLQFDLTGAADPIQLCFQEDFG